MIDIFVLYLCYILKKMNTNRGKLQLYLEKLMVVGNHLQSLSCKHRFAWRREQELIHKTMWSHLIIVLNSLRKTGQRYHIFRTAGHKSRRGQESIFSCGVRLSLVAEKWKQLVLVSEDLLMSAMCVHSGFHVYNAVLSTQWWWKKKKTLLYIQWSLGQRFTTSNLIAVVTSEPSAKSNNKFLEPSTSRPLIN